MPPASPRGSAAVKPAAEKIVAAASPDDNGAKVLAFLLTGPESGRKNVETQNLVKKYVDAEFADFDADTIDGATATADRVLGGAATVPLGAGKRVVLVRDTQQMDTDEQKKLAAGLSRIPASGALILHTGSPIVEDGKAKKASVAAIELVNAVKKWGQVVDFGHPREGDLRDYLLRTAKTLGKTLAPDALSLLTQLPDSDASRLVSELAKAAAHAGDAPVITGADVEATVSRSPDDVIFKLCDAVGARRTREALAHVSTLFKGGARPEAVAPRALVLLARQIRLLAQFRYLGEKGMAGRNAAPISADVLALLPGDGAGGMAGNPRMAWMADKYVGQARNFTGAELAARLEKLLHADLVLKGSAPGGDSPQAVLQRLVVELC